MMYLIIAELEDGLTSTFASHIPRELGEKIKLWGRQEGTVISCERIY